MIDFYYKDPSGNEHRHDRSDDYPHSNIMELLSDYNNSKFEVKELVDSVMNEVFYTILLGLDGETSLGDVQMQYKVYDETDNLLDGIESYAYDSFMNEE